MPLDPISDAVASELPSLALANPAAAVATLAQTVVRVLVGVVTGSELFSEPETNTQTALQNEYDQRTSTDIQIEVMNTCLPPQGSAGQGSRSTEEVANILNRNGANVVNRHRTIVQEVAFLPGFNDPVVDGLVSSWMNNMRDMHNCIEELADEGSFTHNPDPPPRCTEAAMVSTCLLYEDE